VFAVFVRCLLYYISSGANWPSQPPIACREPNIFGSINRRHCDLEIYVADPTDWVCRIHRDSNWPSLHQHFKQLIGTISADHDHSHIRQLNAVKHIWRLMSKGHFERGYAVLALVSDCQDFHLPGKA